MVEYNCILCSYTTCYSTSYAKHLKTKKHLAKEKEIENEEIQNESKLNPIESKMNPILNVNIVIKFIHLTAIYINILKNVQ